MYLDALRFKAPGGAAFAPMRFDTDSRIFMAFILQFSALIVLEAGCQEVDEDGIIRTQHLIAAVDDDTLLRSQRVSVGWELLFAPERAIMREEELHLSELKDRIMACDGVVRTLTHLIGFGEGSTVSKDWNTIFENDEKRLLESDEVRCHTKLICTSLYFFTIICY